MSKLINLIKAAAPGKILDRLYFNKQYRSFIRDRNFVPYFRTAAEWALAKDFHQYQNHLPDNFDQLKTGLKAGLDQTSRDLIRLIPERYEHILYNNLIAETRFYTDQEREEIKKFEHSDYRKIFRPLILAGRFLEPAVFYYDNGLQFLEPRAKQNINQSVIIDVGAYWGDSAYMFSRHYPGADIYSLEPDQKNFQELQQTISQFCLPKVKPINAATGAQAGEIKYHSYGASTRLNNSGDQEIEVISIDGLVKAMPKDKRIGIIKMDIEGMEPETVQGAVKTIQRDHPILLLSIYHTGREFFELKSFIERTCPGVYRFIIRKLHPYRLTLETALIAWPK